MLFQEAFSFGSSQAIECLLRLPEVDGSWWPANKAMVLNVALDSAVAAGLHNTVRLLRRHNNIQDETEHNPGLPLQEYVQKAYIEGDLDMYWALHDPDGDISVAIGSSEALWCLKDACADLIEPDAMRKKIAHTQLHRYPSTRISTPSAPAMSSKKVKAVGASIETVIEYWKDQTFKILGKKS